MAKGRTDSVGSIRYSFRTLLEIQFPICRLYVQVGTVKLGPIRAFLRVFGPVRGSKLGAAQLALAGWLELGGMGWIWVAAVTIRLQS